MGLRHFVLRFCHRDKPTHTGSILMERMPGEHKYKYLCVAVCCRVLQCVAACGSVWQCVVESCSVLQCVAVWCSALQCADVCCKRCDILS